MNKPAISVIITAYNNEKTIEQSIMSVLKQTYIGSIEIIVVDDASSDGTEHIVEKLRKRHRHIIFLQHKTHQGLLSTRIDGVEHSCGDYIAMLSGRDYVSIDYYRSLLSRAQKTNADILISDVIEDVGGHYEIYTLAHNDIRFGELNGDEILNRYFEQEGLNRLWYEAESKFSKRTIWLKALTVLKIQPKGITIGESVIVSCVLMYFSSKVVKIDNVPYFRRSIPENEHANFNEIKNEIHDLILVFRGIDRFLNSVSVDPKLLEHANRWRLYYKTLYYNEINNKRYKYQSARKKETISILEDFWEGQDYISTYGHFYKIQTVWNDKYEKIKKKIASSKYKLISFDIFDTAIVRPFIDSFNVLRLLDDEFRKQANGTFSDFSTIRREAEYEARKKLRSGGVRRHEVTIDDIYMVICNDYGIDDAVARRMQAFEIEKEVEVCRVRNSIYDLYELAIQLNKEVIFVSDMYLYDKSIQIILEKTGYCQYKRVYISSNLDLTKAQGDIYEYIIRDLNVLPGNILHIGDDKIADVKNALKFGIEAVYYPSIKDAFAISSPDLYKLLFNNTIFWQNNTLALNSLSIQLFVSLMINKYFDNPYVTFDSRTDFNCDPSFVGYGAFGMFLYGVVSWIIKDASKKKYDVIGFMSRDGYMPMKIYNIMSQYYNLTVPKPDYVYTSRQAIISTYIQNDSDIFKLGELIDFIGKTPRQLIPLLSSIYGIESEPEIEIILTNNVSIDEVLTCQSDLWRLLRICQKKFYNGNTSPDNELLKDYLISKLPKKACIFDIGYSAKPEMYISGFIGKRIDAYFVHGDSSSSKHAKIAGIELNTLYDYSPQIYGLLDEMLLSEQAGSCIGYKAVNGKAEPIFSSYKFDYIKTSVIRYTQDSALQIIIDALNVIDVNVNVDDQKYYYSMLYNVAIQSIKTTDMELYTDIRFDDDSLGKEGFMLTDYWQTLKKRRNQRTLKDIF